MSADGHADRSGGDRRPIRVAVVFGGRSGEHSVSCASAASVMRHLDPERFDVTPIGIARDGRWVQLDPATPLEIAGGVLPEVGEGRAVAVRTDTTSAALTVHDHTVAGAAALDVDVVFPVLHGPYGEDGTLQGLLELAGLPYVGPGVLASAAAMDKEFTKKVLTGSGIPMVEWAVLRPRDATLSPADRDRLGLPVFVKPARAGSSLGVRRVDDWADLDAAIAYAREADPKVLVETAMSGREIECGVLEFPDGRVEASPTAEIHVAHGHDFYDFEAKYLDDGSTYDVPAKVPDEITARVQQLAVRAFHALDAQGLARVDFFVGDDGSVVVNEVNTMPGFTPISMYPRMWAEGGISYPALLSTLVETALARGVGLR
jgi:D-alanine-D-alanine ligase